MVGIGCDLHHLSKLPEQQFLLCTCDGREDSVVKKLYFNSLTFNFSGLVHNCFIFYKG